MLTTPRRSDHSLLGEVLSGTRKSTIISHTIKTARSSTHSSSKIARPVSPLLMRKRQRPSLRRCMSGRNMQARKPVKHRSHQLAARVPPLWPMANLAWDARCSAVYWAIGHPLVLVYHLLHPHPQHLPRLQLNQLFRAGPRARSCPLILVIHHGRGS